MPDPDAAATWQRLKIRWPGTTESRRSPASLPVGMPDALIYGDFGLVT
jgi:hypothetical protein